MFASPPRRLAFVLLTLQGACSITTRSGEPAARPAATSREPEPPAYQPRQPSSKRIPIGSGDAVWGSPTAPATIVVFTDLECPFCAHAELTLEELKVQYGAEELRVVVKHAPFHDHSELAARYAQAALALRGPEAFFRFMKLAFERQGELASEGILKQLVERAGVDPIQAADAALSEQVSNKLEADAELAQQLQVNGTPAFFVNGALISGAQPLPAFTSVIDSELAEAEKLVAEGMPAQLVYATRVGTNAALADAAQARELAQAKQEEAEQQEDVGTLWKVPVAGTPLRGPRDAPITIVEFSDYECQFSRRAQITIDKLFELYPGKLRLSRRENPLNFHQHALPAAMFAQEARARRGDAGYFEATTKLFQSGLEPAHLDDIAKELGLDVGRTRRAIEKSTHLAAVERDQDLAVAVKVKGTPHFFVNGWRISGAQPVETFREVIDAQLKVAEALARSGVPARRLYDELQKTAREPQPERWQLPPAPAASAPSRGKPNAPVVIEFFGDLQCPYCASAAQTLSLVEGAFPGKVRVVWRHFPLESIHPRARLAARVALEARAQKDDGAFWQVVNLFYRDLAEPDAFSDERIKNYAAELGLNQEALLAAGKDGRHDAAIDADLAAAKASGMDGAPSISVGGYRVVGAQSLATFRYFVRQALKKPATK